MFFKFRLNDWDWNFDDLYFFYLLIISNIMNVSKVRNSKILFSNFFKICFSKFALKSLNGNIGVLHYQAFHIIFDCLRSINIDFEHISNSQKFWLANLQFEKIAKKVSSFLIFADGVKCLKFKSSSKMSLFFLLSVSQRKQCFSKVELVKQWNLNNTKRKREKRKKKKKLKWCLICVSHFCIHNRATFGTCEADVIADGSH